MSDLFKEIIPSILQTKEYVLENEKDYVPFIVNRALSYHYDCAMYANEMNRLPNTDRKLQYDFYLNSIRGYRRPFQRWQKREEDDALEAVKEYYGYSNEKAKEALSILSDAQVDEIKKRLYKGGLNDQHKRFGGGQT
jgi:hypothetical protein